MGGDLSLEVHVHIAELHDRLVLMVPKKSRYRLAEADVCDIQAQLIRLTVKGEAQVYPRVLLS
jgi:hypothetical protein